MSKQLNKTKWEDCFNESWTKIRMYMISGSVFKNIFDATTWWRCSIVSLFLKFVDCHCNFLSSSFHTGDEVIGVDFLVVIAFTLIHIDIQYIYIIYNILSSRPQMEKFHGVLVTFADVINDKLFIEIVARVWSDNDGEDLVVSIAGHFWY